jgi:hypothetical protein
MIMTKTGPPTPRAVAETGAAPDGAEDSTTY